MNVVSSSPSPTCARRGNSAVDALPPALLATTQENGHLRRQTAQRRIHPRRRRERLRAARLGGPAVRGVRLLPRAAARALLRARGRVRAHLRERGRADHGRRAPWPARARRHPALHADPGPPRRALAPRGGAVARGVARLRRVGGDRGVPVPDVPIERDNGPQAAVRGARRHVPGRRGRRGVGVLPRARPHLEPAALRGGVARHPDEHARRPRRLPGHAQEGRRRGHRQVSEA